MTHELLSGLNAAQARAVSWDEGALMVLAGAGTGKTRVVTQRIAWLIRETGLPAWSILAMTFTNRSARELKGRVDQLLGGTDHAVMAGTFHSTAVRFLRGFADRIGYEAGFSIIDGDDQLRLLKRLAKEAEPHLSAKEADTHAKGARRLVEEWAREGNRLARGEGPAVDDKQAWLLPVIRAYDRSKKSSQLMDFNDLLLYLLEVLRDDEDARRMLAGRFRHVLVDEFQDTNRVQLEIVKLLVGSGDGLTVVGDDDQSIYAWRGARVENLLHLDREYPGLTVIALEENYRSTQTILTAAYHAIRKNPHLQEKRLFTNQGAGEPIQVMACDSEADEAVKISREIGRIRRGGIPANEIAVFFRTNAQSRHFEVQLRKAKIPHKVIGGQRFFERKEVKDLLAFARLVANPADRVAFERVVNTPPRGIGDKTVVEVLSVLASQEPPPIMDAARAYAASKGGRAGGAVGRFVQLLDSLEVVARAGDLLELFKSILDQTGYLARLQEEGSLEAEGRLENLGSLVSSVAEYEAQEPEPTLQGYLESVSLQTDQDEWDEGEGQVALMTVHAAKGLEFDAVFVSGLEDGLFPHLFSMEDRGVEEERRLFHVAITRARKHLWFSHARTRARFGQWQYAVVSPFLADLPPEILSGGRPRRRQSLNARIDEQRTWVDYSDSQLPPDED
jgi:DNA helicase II / ATP-dependent DNA helicase PcrA